MKFKSQVYSAVSGSVGGLTYSHNAGGMYTRARAMPSNPSTTRQSAVRNAVANVAAAWSQSLDSAERTAWEAFASNLPVTDKLGDTRNISGINWFTKCNIARIQAGLSRVDAAPATFAMAELSPVAMTVNASTDIASIAFTNTDGWATEVGGALLVYISPPQNPGVSSFKGPYQYAGKISGAVTAPTSPQTMATPSLCAAGQKIFAKVVAVRADARISSPFRTGAVAS